MKKSIRILLLLSPLVVFGFIVLENVIFRPPINTYITQPVSINALLEKPDVYKAPMVISLSGEVKNRTGNDLFLSGLFNVELRVNCSGINIDQIQPGMILYVKGYSYIHDIGKNYLLAVEIHISYSFSLYLSIPGAIIVIIILFVIFKFNYKDFSFSRRKEEHRGA